MGGPISARLLIGRGDVTTYLYLVLFARITIVFTFSANINHRHGHDSRWSVCSHSSYCAVECRPLGWHFSLAYTDAGADIERHKPSSRLVSLVGARCRQTLRIDTLVNNNPVQWYPLVMAGITCRMGRRIGRDYRKSAVPSTALCFVLDSMVHRRYILPCRYCRSGNSTILLRLVRPAAYTIRRLEAYILHVLA